METGNTTASLVGEPDQGNPKDPRAQPVTRGKRLRTALISDKREALEAMCEDRTIDDVVLQRVQADLDTEEIRLSDTYTDD